MGTRLPGFKGEYLWEFDIADRQLTALAEAFPAERYGWRSAETARSASEILVHIAAGNLTLLGIVGVEAPPDLYGKLECEIVPRMIGMIEKNDGLEKTITDKPAVIALVRRSLDAVRATFTKAPDSELERQDVFFGERTTVRRVYLRGLSYMHGAYETAHRIHASDAFEGSMAGLARIRTKDHRTGTKDGRMS